LRPRWPGEPGGQRGWLPPLTNGRHGGRYSPSELCAMDCL